MKYNRCLLRKKSGNILREAWAWLTEELAAPGEYVEIRDFAGNWESGWQVIASHSLEYYHE